ncbi:MAG: beta strand repeat-containing protein [Thermoanaerobaculia bacterium]
MTDIRWVTALRSSLVAGLALGATAATGGSSGGTPAARSTVSSRPVVIQAEKVSAARSQAVREIRLSARSTGDVIVTVDGVTALEVPAGERRTLPSLEIRGGTGDKTLTVDFSNGNPVPAGGLLFDGESGAVNSLVLQGGSSETATATAFGPGSGSIVYTGGTVGAASIRYAHLTPVTDAIPGPNIIINGTAAAEPINIIDGPGGTTEVNSGGAWELVRFANKTSATVNGKGGADTFTLNNPNPGAGLTTLTLVGGATAGVVFNVTATPASVRTSVVGGAQATVNVGTGGSVQGILGELNIENPVNFNTIVIDDSSDAISRTVSFSTFSSNPADSEGNSDPWVKIHGLSPGDINYEPGDTASLTVSGGNGGNSFKVSSLSSGTTINGGSGADGFQVDASGLGPGSVTTLNGQGGNDVFAVSGALSGGAVLAIDGGAPTLPASPGDVLKIPASAAVSPGGPGAGSVPGLITSYASIEGISKGGGLGGTFTLNGGGGADLFQMNASRLASGSIGNLNGQAGNDVFNVTGTLDPGAALNIDGGAPIPPVSPGDVLNIPSSASLVPSGPGAGSVPNLVTSYTSIEGAGKGSGLGHTLTINGGNGADTFDINVSSLGSGSVNNLNGQNGNDTFTVAGNLNPGAILNIDGGAPVAPASPGDTLNAPPWAVVIPAGPGAGSIPDVVTSFVSIEGITGAMGDYASAVPALGRNAIALLAVLLALAGSLALMWRRQAL